MASDPDIFPPRLYLVTPKLSAASPFDKALAAAIDAGDVACLLIRFATDDPAARKQIVRDLAPLAQKVDAAVLLEGDAQLAARAGADGVHINGNGEAFERALDSLKPERIVGVGGLATRDECMSVGERDVDYLMFGWPDFDVSPQDVREQAQWWAEIFNVPCVAFARTLGEVEALAEARVEFVALENAVWEDPRGPAVAVADAQKRCVGALA
ncbi:MAG: thiamine phosphate synthase [Hyphomicrobiales bacterium]|nr:thiamine phosphate synthase [Hyphomicrobiales bacterium]